jgi:hypothetical protein
MSNKQAQFKELINNKSIIIVGPSANLENLSMGTWIDSFDTVVKFNNTVYSNDSVDQGAKIDILYINNFYTKRKYFIESPLKDRVQMLVMKSISDSNLYEEHNQEVNTRILDKTPFLIGIAAIKDILNFSPHYLYVTGMDFYQSSESYYSNYEIIDHSQKHNINKNISELNRLIKKYPNLEIDESIKKALIN